MSTSTDVIFDFYMKVKSNSKLLELGFVNATYDDWNRCREELEKSSMSDGDWRAEILRDFYMVVEGVFDGNEHNFLHSASAIRGALAACTEKLYGSNVQATENEFERFIQVLRLQPGDKLVIKLPASLSQKEQEETAAYINENWKVPLSGIEFLVCGNDIDFMVIRPGEAQ